METDKVVFMTDFGNYLASLPSSPLVEAVSAIYEGLSSDHRVTYCHNYYEEGVPELCHAVKEGDHDAIDKMAKEMARYVSPDTTLVPVPSRNGTATTTMELAGKIGWYSGCDVADILRGGKRRSLYDMKKQGMSVSADMLGLYLDGDIPVKPLLVDNVVATGTTASAALSVIPNARVLAYAIDLPMYEPANR